MLLLEIAHLMMEMARPAKICPTCGKSMAGYHYWYKGGWKCKKSSLAGKDEVKKDDKPAAKKEAPKKEAPKKQAPPAKKDDDDEKEHHGAVKGMEREAGEEKDPDVTAAEKIEKDKKRKTVKSGSTITASEMSDVTADSEGEARSQIADLFPKATPEAKARALNVWKAKHKKKED